MDHAEGDYDVESTDVEAGQVADIGIDEPDIALSRSAIRGRDVRRVVVDADVLRARWHKPSEIAVPASDIENAAIRGHSEVFVGDDPRTTVGLDYLAKCAIPERRAE